VYVGNDGIDSPPLFFSLYCMFFVCIKRPEALASLWKREGEFFGEKEEEHSSGGDERVLLTSDTKGEVGNDYQKDNTEETRLDDNEEEANNSKKMEEEQMDNDDSRKYPVIGTEEKGDEVAESPLPPAARDLLLFVAVVLVLVAGWYARKVQRKRSGWHKKIED
jgi:hypothetical protein